jgi:hypothetical protein
VRKLLLVAVLMVAASLPLSLRAQVSGNTYGIGTALPASCYVGQTFFLTTAGAGTNWYGCTSSNTWTNLSTAGTGTVTSVGLIGTANQITVTGASPITGAGSWTLSIPTNPTLPGTTTGTFSGSLAGNATTATNLASYPTLCGGGQFSQGLSSGSNNCATPAGGGGSPGGAQYNIQLNSGSSTFSGSASLTSDAANDLIAAGYLRGTSLVISGTNAVALSNLGVVEYLNPNMRFSLASTESYFFYNQGRGTNLLMELNGATGLVNVPALTASTLVTTDGSKNLVTAAIAADNIYGNFTGGSAVPGLQAIPACANDGGHALVYVSHTLTCETITGGGSGYTTIDVGGTPLTQRAILNFASSSTITQACADNSIATRTDCNPGVNTTAIPTVTALQQGDAMSCISTNGTQAYTCTPVTGVGAGPTALKAGMFIPIYVDTSSTGGAVTLNFETLGIKSVKQSDGSTNPASGQIVANAPNWLAYDGTLFRLPPSSAGGVSSFTGDGTLINNSASTGGVTVTLATAGAHKWWGNNTGSTAAPGYESIGLPDLAAQAADTVVMNASGSSTAPTAVAMPTSGTNGCAGTSNALTYNTSTHAFGCNSISGSVTGSQGITVSGSNASLYDLTKPYMREDFIGMENFDAFGNAYGSKGLYLCNKVTNVSVADACAGPGITPLSNGMIGVWGATAGAVSGDDVILQHQENSNQSNFPALTSTTWTYETRIALAGVANNYLGAGFATNGSFGTQPGIWCDVTNTGSAGNWACHVRSTATTTVTLSPAQTADTNPHVISFTMTNASITFFFDGVSVGTTTVTANFPATNGIGDPQWEAKTNTTATATIWTSGWRFYQ